ncbi:MAG: transposase [Pseudomonadota bacterium]
MGTRRKRRNWSDDEKREICQQTMVPGVSVAQVARRYATNANQIHNWLKDERFAPEPDEGFDDDEGDAFLEVDLTQYSPPVPGAVPTAPPLGGPISATRIDLTLSDGRRVLIEGPMALSAIVSLVEGLST